MLEGMSSWYSDYPFARTSQIAADLVALSAIVLAILMGVLVGSAIGGLAEVGRQVEAAGTGLQTTLGDAGDRLGQVPVVGDGIRVPLDEASEAGAALAGAGRDLQTIVQIVAILAGVLVGVGPILLVLLIWLLPRLVFLRRSREVRMLNGSPDGPSLLALRALTRRPYSELSAVSTSPLHAWRSGDAATISGLASLELRRAGVKG